MSTPDQPHTPPLTRRQLRELRNTGTTPVIDTAAVPLKPSEHAAAGNAEPAATAGAAPVTTPPVDTPLPARPVSTPASVRPATVVPSSRHALRAPSTVSSHESAHAADAASPRPAPPRPAPPRPVAPLPHAAVPAAAHPAPAPDASIDLEAVPLTRRQAREQERIRTASVPVIMRDVPAASATSTPWHGTAPSGTAPSGIAPAGPAPAGPAPVSPAPSAPSASAGKSASAAQPGVALQSGIFVPPAPAPTIASGRPVASATHADRATDTATATAVMDPTEWAHQTPTAEPAPRDDAAADPAVAAAVHEMFAPVLEDDDVTEASAAQPERTTVHPALGARLLAQPPAGKSTAGSFEELLGRGTQARGTSTASHALILPHPASAPLVAPIDSTGEVLVTGTFALPDGMGSTGHAPGTTDGREVDAALVDGELPVHSSPTPIAASAAVSTIRTDDDIVNPPAPEKGRRLMMVLAITAGVLALGLIGVLVYALATGVIA